MATRYQPLFLVLLLFSLGSGVLGCEPDYRWHHSYVGIMVPRMTVQAGIAAPMPIGTSGIGVIDMAGMIKRGHAACARL